MKTQKPSTIVKPVDTLTTDKWLGYSDPESVAKLKAVLLTKEGTTTVGELETYYFRTSDNYHHSRLGWFQHLIGSIIITDLLGDPNISDVPYKEVKIIRL